MTLGPHESAAELRAALAEQRRAARLPAWIDDEPDWRAETIAELREQVRELQQAVARLRTDLDHVQYRVVPDAIRDLDR